MTTNGAFKTEEICAIIKECGISGVRVFEYDGLKLEMGVKKLPPVEEEQTPVPTVIVPPEVQIVADTQTRAAQAQEEQDKKQQELDQLLIDDPEGYFEAIRLGDLVDEKRT